MPNDETTREEKVYNLVVELEIARRNKRETMKAHTEEVNRIAAEIKDLLTKDDLEE